MIKSNENRDQDAFTYSGTFQLHWLSNQWVFGIRILWSSIVLSRTQWLSGVRLLQRFPVILSRTQWVSGLRWVNGCQSLQRPWQQNPRDQFRFRTGDSGDLYGNTTLGVEQHRTSSPGTRTIFNFNALPFRLDIVFTSRNTESSVLGTTPLFLANRAFWAINETLPQLEWSVVW